MGIPAYKPPEATVAGLRHSIRTRLLAAKAAHTTRRAARPAMSRLLTDGDTVPRPDDLVLARVTHLGRHQHIELATGRRAKLFIGDEVIACYGNRYAPDQFEAVVPNTLAPCHLVAGGGIVAQALCWHDSIGGPTRITPIGLVVDQQGERLNLRNWGLKPAPNHRAQRPATLAVVGASMNAGKTTTAAFLINGAVNAGLKVAAAKLTGTGAGRDIWLMRDAGADPVLDFTDAGFASTYRISCKELERIATTLIGHLGSASVDVIVLEIADGLFQQETAALLSSPVFASNVDGLIFAANDAIGAAAGVDWLRARNLPVLGISGILSRSPLATREAAIATALPVINLQQLRDATSIAGLIERATTTTANQKAG